MKADLEYLEEVSAEEMAAIQAMYAAEEEAEQARQDEVYHREVGQALAQAESEWQAGYQEFLNEQALEDNRELMEEELVDEELVHSWSVQDQNAEEHLKLMDSKL